MWANRLVFEKMRLGVLGYDGLLGLVFAKGMGFDKLYRVVGSYNWYPCIKFELLKEYTFSESRL